MLIAEPAMARGSCWRFGGCNGPATIPDLLLWGSFAVGSVIIVINTARENRKLYGSVFGYDSGDAIELAVCTLIAIPASMWAAWVMVESYLSWHDDAINIYVTLAIIAVCYLGAIIYRKPKPKKAESVTPLYYTADGKPYDPKSVLKRKVT